jgi:cytochrome c-type biogenesis protein CcmH/NrfG
MNFFQKILMLSRIFGIICGLVGCSRNEAVKSYSPADHNQLFKEGSELITPYMRLHGQPRDPKITSRARKDVSRGIELLQAVVTTNSQNWAAYWFIGKGYQTLGKTEEACDAFRNSFSLQKQNADVAREYMFECLDLGRAQEGVDAAEHAVSLEPKEPGLIANLALAYLIAGKNGEALTKAEEALALDPGDKLTQTVVRVIREVASGKKPQPKTLKDVDGS